MPSASNQEFTSTPYDYIIAGAGCAGLSLLMHMVESEHFSDKKILLVDKEIKNKNDRTWCFWEQEAGLFEPIVKKQWQQLWFKAEGFSKKMDLQPYHYKLIRGIDFYKYCLERIATQQNITFLKAPVERFFSNAAGTGMIADGVTYNAKYIFNSILFQKPILNEKQYWLLQHFKGWFIETPTAQFDPEVGTLMDFRTDQRHGATFFYVLPFSTTQALVEYTFFSKDVLPDAVYETALQQYVEETLAIKDYAVKEKEFGVIPMSNYRFPARQHNIVNIGTAGGQTKASSGYTFRFIQKQSKELVHNLKQHGTPFSKPHARRFHFYDSVLLHILHHNTLRGAAIFTDLFKKNATEKVLKFLDNETTLPEELGIISTLPTRPFLKAAIKLFT